MKILNISAKGQSASGGKSQKLKIGAEFAHSSLKTRQAHVENDAHSGFSKRQRLPRSLSESLSKSLNQKGKTDSTAFSSFSNGLPSSSGVDKSGSPRQGGEDS